MRAIAKGLIRLIVFFGVALGVAAGLVALLEQENRENGERWAREQAERAQQEAAERLPYELAFGSRDPAGMLQQCRNGVLRRLGYLPWVIALAYSEERVDAYYYRSTRLDSLHRYVCTKTGIVDSRVEHPLAEQVRAERERQVEAPASREVPDLWSEMQARASTSNDGRHIEMLLAPSGTGWIERTTARDGTVQVTPADTPPFPRLYADGAATVERDPMTLRERPFTRWSSSADAAFEVLARELPAGARIAALRLDDDEIEVSVIGPLPGLDAPYGDVDIDNWGEVSNWLYPRQEPGFGCTTGVPLEVVRERFRAACSSVPGCKSTTHFSIADYSCSRSGDGKWTLHVQSAN